MSDRGEPPNIDPDVFNHPTLHKVDRPWSDYPIGTKAHSVTGGAWTKTAHGWKWGALDGSGGTFPTPGGDACGECVELPAEKLSVGDEVIATKTIVRHDHRCALLEGKTAKVIRVDDSTGGSQIVAIELSDGNQMIDIVCTNGIPLIKHDLNTRSNEPGKD